MKEGDSKILFQGSGPRGHIPRRTGPRSESFRDKFTDAAALCRVQRQPNHWAAVGIVEE